MLLASFKEQFDELLSTYLNKQLKTLARSHAAHEDLNEVWLYLTNYVQGGKRVRPYLVWLSYTGFGGSDEQLPWEIGIAHELLHIFALIHDDIIDQGTVRHSIPTYHLRVASLYNNEEVGVSQAILVGDMLFQWAIRQFITHTDNKQAQEHLFSMFDEVIYGQSLDVHLSHTELQKNTDAIQLKDSLKTASYTFTRPMLVGSTLAAQEDYQQQIKQLGELLGRAYQLRDDLLDVTGGHKNKTILSDLQEGNQTVLLISALEQLPSREQEILMSYRGKQLTPDEQKKAQQLFHQSGAIEHTQQIITKLLDQAEQELASIGKHAPLIEKGLGDIINLLRVG